MKYVKEIAFFSVVTILLAVVFLHFALPGKEDLRPCQNSLNLGDGYMAKSLLLNQGEFQEKLVNLSEITEKTARISAEKGLFGDYIQAELDKAQKIMPGIVTIGIFDSRGICTAMSPLSHNIIGWDLSETPVVSSMNEEMVPQMTGLFALSEGGYAASVNYPVFSNDKKYTGFVSLTFDPYTFFNEPASDFMNNTEYQVMIAQKDGVVLYDTDINEIGKETFNNPMYDEFPEVLEFAKAYSDSFSGEFEYSYLDKTLSKNVDKKAIWTTIGLHGEELRLISIREL